MGGAGGISQPGNGIALMLRQPRPIFIKRRWGIMGDDEDEKPKTSGDEIDVDDDGEDEATEMPSPDEDDEE